MNKDNTKVKDTLNAYKEEYEKMKANNEGTVKLNAHLEHIKSTQEREINQLKQNNELIQARINKETENMKYKNTELAKMQEKYDKLEEVLSQKKENEGVLKDK